MSKKAKTDYEINPLLAARWSPRAFADRPVGPETLQKLFEAARWSASSSNQQPWRFIIGRRGEGATYQRIFDTLLEGNQAWADNAPVFVLVVAKTTFNHKEATNKWAWYDTGASAASLTMQATSDGLYVHQMAGFSADKAREAFNIPDAFVPVAVMAIGYLGDPEMLADKFKERELAERERFPLSELVFSETWGQTSDLFDQ